MYNLCTTYRKRTDAFVDKCSASIQASTAATQGSAQAGGADSANNAGDTNISGNNPTNNNASASESAVGAGNVASYT